ncbi:metal dependent phosphohydrolase [Fibrisoma limi BUZ 3]|uniref:Metal dependent phosphohydrolase n=1 Tax=Fibrisoma limi BUZ 3 TaxID=1185876 RepID=I2GT85_9BACT|nr:Pycsar system effector family protein [Fibrisoma limi]CCH57114.1 metal dependent phosphohydrolase [Fibrisoma limi BUZ 3]
MIAEETSLLAQTRAYAESVLGQISPDYTYHNLSHTQAVVEFADEIAVHEGLLDTDRETVLIAAWLHDVGYRMSCDNHEAIGVDMARPFLIEHGLPTDRIEQVVRCIEATRMPQNPRGNRLAEILCDADMGHLAASDFAERSEMLRQELKRTGVKIGKKKWLKKTAELIEHHQYFTAYARQAFEPRKAANLVKLQRQIAEQKDDEKDEISWPDERADKEPKPDKDKNRRPERGVETMFRLTSQNHFQLSAMADTKANIMISINTIVVSLVLSILLRKLEEWPMLTLPTAMLTITCVLATVLAVLATRPNVTTGRFSRADIENKTANLLFFGNFHRMELDDYEWGMRHMMNDADFLYSSMTRDIYYLGKVLGRKYKLLRWSYTVFMVGFVLSVLAFGGAAYLSR